METVEMKKKPWETLPSLALLNIFRNLNFKDRFGTIPLVCKEWNSVISDDPRCWSSMIPESISPDDAFIKKPDYSFQVNLPSKLYDSKGQEIVRDQGVSYLRNFIKKSSSCSSSDSGSSTISSLCLDPFHFSNSSITIDDDSIHQDEILGLIARCCPNLKHISFDGFYCASIEAIVQVFKRCKKIELVDFSDSGYTDSLEVIKVLGKYLPNLRGLRIAGWIEDDSIYDAIAKHLPRIKLLALDYRSSYDIDFGKLTSKTKCCLTELQYLSVGLWEIKEPPVCSTHIPEFHYEKLFGYECDFGDYEFQPLRSVHRSKHRPRPHTYKQQVCDTCLSMKKKYEAEAKAKAKAKEAYSECSIMKQKKEYEMGSYIPPQDEIQMRPPAKLPTRVFRPSSQVSRPYQPQRISTRPPTQMFRPSSQVFRQSNQVSRPYQPQRISTRPPTQMFRPSSQVFRQPSKVSRPYQPQPQVFIRRRPSKVYKPYQPQGIPTRPSTQVFRPSSQVSKPYEPQRRLSWQAKCTPVKAPSPRGMRPPSSPRGMRTAPQQHMRATSPQHVRTTPPQYTRAPQHMMSPPHARRPPPFRSTRPPPMRSNTMANKFTVNKYSYARWPEPQHGYGMNEVSSSYDGNQHGSSYNRNTQPQ